MTVKVAEKALLAAVRDRLCRPVAAGGGGYALEECNVEVDEGFPATVGDVYIAVMPGGWSYGPRHQTSGGVRDLIYGVNVAVVRRVGNVPRDRKRDTALLNLGSMNDDVDRVIEAIDWKEEVRLAANVIILEQAGSSEGFIHSLVASGQVGPPRPCPPEMFGAAGGKLPAGMMRVVPFHGARRITTIL